MEAAAAAAVVAPRKRLRRCDAAPTDFSIPSSFAAPALTLHDLFNGNSARDNSTTHVAAEEEKFVLPELDILAALSTATPPSMESPELCLDVVSGKKRNLASMMLPTSPVDPSSKSMSMLTLDRLPKEEGEDDHVLAHFKRFGVV